MGYKKCALSHAALIAGVFSITTSGALADQVFLDDVIVDGSLCVGLDCVNGESFGFDTIRMKENNLRLNAEDTSASASFPSNDWTLVFNDSSNGGLNKFAVQDDDAGREPFTIEAGARANALYVESDGDVGIGTNNPSVDLTVVTGNTPTLRLEQDGSSGFTPQTFDLAANEANFFVRDVTNGSQLSFRIFPGSPQNSLVVEPDGVGIGVQSALAPLHVQRSASSSADMIRLQSNGAAVLRLVDASLGGQEWTFQSNGGVFRVASPAVPGPEMTVDDNGNMTISGELTTSGSCSVGCDRVFDQDYELKPLAEHNAMMWENKHLPNVGPTVEEGPMNLSQKVGGILNELEHAHIYIGQLHERDQARAAQLAAQQDVLEALQERIRMLEDG